MDLDELVQGKSNYMRKEDVGQDGVDLTILGFKKVKVESDDGNTEEKIAMLFVEDDYKPMLLNITNKDLLKEATGAITTEDCKGKRINVYNDPSVRFGKKQVGGLRIRPTLGAAASKLAKAELGLGEDYRTVDVPF